MYFNNLRIVLTGTPPGQRSRKDVEAFLRQQGAYIENKINYGTDYLIYGRSNTVKYREAIDKGVKAITYNEYFDMVGSGKGPDRSELERAKLDAQAKRAISKGEKKLRSLRNELSVVQTSAAEW